MSIIKFLFAVIVLAALGLGGAYFWAGRGAHPNIEIHQPTKLIGQAGTLSVTVDVPGGALSALDVRLEQNGRFFPLFALGSTTSATLYQENAERTRVSGPLGRQSLSDLRPGAARLFVMARRPVLFGLRQLESQAVRDLKVQFEPPRLEILSSHHYVNHGGSELVVYRVSPADAESGVTVGDRKYPGYSAARAGVGTDPAVRLTFFALLYDQDLNTPIQLFARDEAANEASARFDHQAFPKPFARSRIELTDSFLTRAVPVIVQSSPELGLDPPTGDQLLPAFLKINGELRRRNAETIAALAQKTSTSMLWSGAFQQLGNSQVESRFADHRTYFYRGTEVDQQVHLGFDLAVTSSVPVLAANAGIILHASNLGIYGNMVLIDHGLGVQSLYAHLSTFAVKVGDRVEKGQRKIGRAHV